MPPFENMDQRFKTPRPSESDFEEKMRQMRIMSKGENKALAIEETDFQANVDEIREYANGTGDKEDMGKWYPGWTQEDFAELLRRLENEGLI